MSIEDLQNICYKLPGVGHDMRLGDHLCFHVNGHGFLYTYPDATPPSASFKVPDEDFEEVIAKDGIEAHKYVGRYKWVTVKNINSLSQQEWELHIKQSYDLIVAKLSKKARKAIGFE